MNYKRLIYKRKYSAMGIMLFLIIGSIHTSFKITKWLIVNTYKGIIWLRRYLKFIKVGYGYNEIYNLIKEMDGRTFEVFMAELFKASGKYKKVILTQQTNDGGKDVILVDKNNEKTYVELKRWSDKQEIGRIPLQKLAGSAYADRIENMIFITTSHYNKNAYEYAAKLDNLELWDMTDIMKLVVKINQEKIPYIMAKTLGVNQKIVKLNPIQG